MLYFRVVNNILNKYILSLCLLYCLGITLHAQDYRAIATDVKEPIYHLFSSSEYPCVALSNGAVYKVFGKTIVKCLLPNSLSLDGRERAVMIANDKEIFVAQEAGLLVINFSNCDDISLTYHNDETPRKMLSFDDQSTLFYVNQEGAFRQKFSSPPVSILDDNLSITDSKAIDTNGNFAFSDINRGVYRTYGDSLGLMYYARGVTDFDYINRTLFVNQQGKIKKITSKGTETLLTTLPYEHRNTSKVYYDNDYNLWLLSNDLFAYNLSDQKIHRVIFGESQTPYDIVTANGKTYIATYKGIYIFQRSIEQVVHTKTQHEIPMLYDSGSKNIVADNGDLYEVSSSTSMLSRVSTNIQYPIPSSDGWWVNLNNKLIKVGDKKLPPFKAPQGKTNYITKIKDTNYALGTSEGIFLQDLQQPDHSLHTVRGKWVNTILNVKNDSLLSGTSQGIYTTDLITGISESVISHLNCSAKDIILKSADTIYTCSDQLFIISDQDSTIIKATEDLNVRQILDLEIIGENCYILTSNQLLRSNYSDLKIKNFTNLARYLTFQSDEGRIVYQNGLLYIESMHDVSYVNPSRLTTHKLTPESVPKFTYEYNDEGLGIYDQNSNGENNMRYMDNNGDWASIEDNSIAYKHISENGILIQKKNLYGDWIPLKVNPVNVIPKPKESKIGWMLLAVSLIIIIFLISRFFTVR